MGCDNDKTIEVMFAGINMYWALLRIILANVKLWRQNTRATYDKYKKTFNVQLGCFFFLAFLFFLSCRALFKVHVWFCGECQGKRAESGFVLSGTPSAGDNESFSWILGASVVWHWSGTGSGKTGELLSYSVWCGSSSLLPCTGVGSRVECSWHALHDQVHESH